VPLRLSIVTPSFNQARFVGAAMQSVLSQLGPGDEYLVMDGGSTDGSAEIIQQRAAALTHWQSERDAGQYDAITRGLARATGDVMAWLNSDDLYCPWAFALVREIFEALPEVQWLTTTMQIRWDAAGRPVRTLHVPGYAREAAQRGEHLPKTGAFSLGWIQQESTFWRRPLWEKAGGQIGAGYPLAGDFELWLRFFQHADLYAVETPLGGFRFHGDQKTGGDRSDYLAEAERALLAHGGRRHGALGRLQRRLGLRRYPAKIVRHHRRTEVWSVVEKHI
jgi:glycosyltransferase involved in cell wall biosynthesis